MTQNNLPPGCSSPDGGLDHEMEAATEDLLNAIETPECAKILTLMAPVVEHALAVGYAAGMEEGKLDRLQLEQRLGRALTRCNSLLQAKGEA